MGCREGEAALNYLLDTHVLVWWVAGSERLPARYAEPLSSASDDEPLAVSDISLWEIATLDRLGRIELRLPLREWLEHAVAPPLVRRIGISPAVAAETAALPRDFPGDPADRIIAATARVFGLTLLTCDGDVRDAGVVPFL